ncbi:ORF13 [Ranid herpesvirus 2]|uniref:ORF13 n=1 Tax=Ranid herpesvirus 2 TaxID=389214 RepID=Q14W93_9VIRU|nr:ORF13 [Ranid herpesvirus 2]ABG25678.1 ORF13 [Ranid herpesvirus 2]
MQSDEEWCLLGKLVRGMACRQQKINKDWPDFLQALMWHEYAAGRIDIVRYEHEMGTLSARPNVLIPYALKNYWKNAGGEESHGTKNELEELLFFLTHQIPSYKRFIQHYGLTWYTAYAYHRLTDVTCKDGIFHITQRRGAAYASPHMTEDLKRWARDRPPYLLPLDTSFELHVFDTHPEEVWVSQPILSREVCLDSV